MKPFGLALSTLTCLPVPSHSPRPLQLKRSVIFYPLVGALIGGVLVLALRLPLPIGVQAAVTLALWVALTRALHLDGLGDCLDGWLGGRTPKERRRIMKDPALGAFGAAGIGLVLILKFSLLQTLLGVSDAWRFILAIPVFARLALPFSCWWAPPPKGDKGLGSQVLGIPFLYALYSFLLTLPLALLLHWDYLWMALMALAVAAGIAWLSKRLIGGMTGDGLGMTVESAEIALLFLAWGTTA
jgi:adenosylcobinamide-GDP ribazoletransferase